MVVCPRKKKFLKKKIKLYILTWFKPQYTSKLCANLNMFGLFVDDWKELLDVTNIIYSYLPIRSLHSNTNSSSLCVPVFIYLHNKGRFSAVNIFIQLNLAEYFRFFLTSMTTRTTRPMMTAAMTTTAVTKAPRFFVDIASPSEWKVIVCIVSKVTE